MTISLYAATIPVIIRKLTALSAFLDKGEAHAKAKGFESTVLVNARLAPDMFALARQVQIASDAAKGAAARLSGRELPSWPDTETTIAELKARIEKTIDFVKSIPEAEFAGAETRDVTVPVRGEPKQFKGADYALNWALPNIYFHVVTTYAILRHNGVDVVKADYLA